MEFLKDRRTLLALVGGALALLAGLIIANVMGRLLNTDIVVRLDDRDERQRLIRQTVALWT